MSEPTPTPAPNRTAADESPTAGGQRAARQLTRPSWSQLLGGALVGLLGFAAVTQVHSRQADDTYSGLREADLIQVLNGLTAQSRRAENEIASLERTRAQLADSSQRRDAAAKRARDQADTLGILTGTLGATGSGVRITVSDPDGKVSLNNLLAAVEQLRAAGAEAMELNDSIRVVAQTSFEQNEDGLSVDGHRLAAPYVIDAIGNPDTLASAVDFAEGFTYDVEQSGGSVRIAKLGTVTIRSTVPATSSGLAKPNG